MFGMSYGFETIHWLLDDAWAGAELHPRFLYDVQTMTGFVDNVLYPLQEYAYAADAATGWAAQREYDRRPEFAANARPVLLTAEMMFSWMFREVRSLRPFAEAADLLAAQGRLAAALRSGPPGAQRGPIVCGRLLRRPLCRLRAAVADH